MGLVHDHASHSGKVTQRLFGMEVGHLMNLRKASYLRYGGANWQAGFGMLTVVGGKTLPTLVPIVDNRFLVEGEVYKW